MHWTTPLSLGLLLVANTGVLLAQPAVDLAGPKWNAHRNLAQNNPPGTPLAQLLAAARPLASSNAVAWKGLDIMIPGHEVLPPGSLITALLQLYQEQTCKADAIAVGHTSSSVYHLSASGTAVYGDHIFVLDALWKDKQASTLRSRPTIVVTRPGGSLLLDDGPVNFEIRSFPRFQAGVTYLQFLRIIPESSAYQAIDAFSTLAAGRNNWMIARKDFSSLVLPGFGRSALMSMIHGWLQTCK